MRDPAVLLYTGDFLNGCTDLTFEERGQYITLLCLQHQKGRLSEKTIRLSVGSVSVDVMSKFKQDEEGHFYNERMDEEIEKRRQFIETRRVNGLKGGRPIKANAKPNGLANAKANEKLIENENIYLSNEELLKKRETEFKESVRQFSNQYPVAMLKSFCDYWTEPNKSKTKMRFELEKTFEIGRRLATWSSRDKTFTKHEPQAEPLYYKPLPKL